MVKMNFTNNQAAFEYAMYMMLGSYFRKASCKNKLMEKKALKKIFLKMNESRNDWIKRAKRVIME